MLTATDPEYIIAILEIGCSIFLSRSEFSNFFKLIIPCCLSMEGDIPLTTWHESRSLSHDDDTYPDQHLLSSLDYLDTDDPHSTTSEATFYMPVLNAPSGIGNEDANDAHNDGNGDGNESVAGTDREMFARRPDCHDTLQRERPSFHHARRAYNPWSLRRYSLVGLSVVLIGMIATLEYLLLFSPTDENLATSYENEPYLWKYGPTAGEYQTVCRMSGVLTDVSQSSPS